jgi:hypothetical protein
MTELEKYEKECQSLRNKKYAVGLTVEEVSRLETVEVIWSNLLLKYLLNDHKPAKLRTTTIKIEEC